MRRACIVEINTSYTPTILNVIEAGCWLQHVLQGPEVKWPCETTEGLLLSPRRRVLYILPCIS